MLVVLLEDLDEVLVLEEVLLLEEEVFLDLEQDDLLDPEQEQEPYN